MAGDGNRIERTEQDKGGGKRAEGEGEERVGGVGLYYPAESLSLVSATGAHVMQRSRKLPGLRSLRKENLLRS